MGDYIRDTKNQPLCNYRVGSGKVGHYVKSDRRK